MMSAMQIRGARLREGREAQNKSIDDVASEISVAESTYRKWEYGQTEPKSLTQVASLCRAVGISIDYYITGTECAPELPPHDRRLIEKLQQVPPHAREAVFTLVAALPAQIEE